MIIFFSASIQRWNDYPRMVELVELDKQAHKFIIAYFIAKLRKDINYTPNWSWNFEFLRRVVVTDIRPDVLEKLYKKNQKRLTLGLFQNLLLLKR